MEDLLKELNRRLLFRFTQVINLIQNEKQFGHPGHDLPQKIQFHLADGWICGNEKQGRVALRKKGQRRLRVMAVRGTDAGRIDQDNALAEDRRLMKDLDLGDAESIVRIEFLGYIFS